MMDCQRTMSAQDLRPATAVAGEREAVFPATAVAGVFWLAGGGPAAGSAAAAWPAPWPGRIRRRASEGLVGSHVDITLRSGKVLSGLTIVEVRPGDVPGTVATLRVYDPAKQLRSVLGASAIQRVATADGTVLLAFDKKSNTLAPPDPEKLAEIRKAASAGPGGAAEPAARAKSGRRRRPPQAEGGQAAGVLQEDRRHALGGTLR